MSGYPTDAEAKRSILDIGRKLYERGFVAANDGNLSVRVGENAVWATPTGVSKGSMTEEMLVKLDLDGHVLEGTHKPSSEVKMHLRVYREQPQMRGVAHAHPPFSTTFAAAGLALDEALIQETVVLVGTVPVAPYAVPGSAALADSVAPFCHTHSALLLEHHGLVTWGRSLEQAYFFLESAEALARVMLYTRQLGVSHRLTESQIDSLIALRPSWGLDAGRGGRPKGRPDA